MSQEYLTREPTLIRHREVLRLLDALENASTAGEGVANVMAATAMHCLSTQLLERETLHPTNWRVARPALVVNARLTNDTALALEARPWPERVEHTPERWTFLDFAYFPLNEPLNEPRLTVCELELGALARELHDSDLPVNPDAALSRKLLFAVYEFLVERLAWHFACRVEAPLVCVGRGDGNAVRLFLRRHVEPDGDVPLNGRPVESEPDFPAAYRARCRQVGVNPDELLALHNACLVGRPEAEQLKALADFLGRPDCDGREHAALLQELQAATDLLLPVSPWEPHQAASGPAASAEPLQGEHARTKRRPGRPRDTRWQ
jgi:hypothetical protein